MTSKRAAVTRTNLFKTLNGNIIMDVMEEVLLHTSRIIFSLQRNNYVHNFFVIITHILVYVQDNNLLAFHTWYVLQNCINPTIRSGFDIDILIIKLN